MTDTIHPLTGFDLATIDRIEVLPLGLGQAAPNRREATFNGGLVASKRLNTDRTLVWQSPRALFAGREPFSPRPPTHTSFLLFSAYVDGRHNSGTVAIIPDDRFETAVEIARSLLSSDGRRGTRGVGEWSPAFVTIDGQQQLALHIHCLDGGTEAAVQQLLTEHAGLLARIDFNHLRDEQATVEHNGARIDGTWTPLWFHDHPQIVVNGVSSGGQLNAALLDQSLFADRVRAANAPRPRQHPSLWWDPD